MLQLVWAHKELRRPLEKDGWKKTDFMVNLSSGTTNGPSTRANGTHEESTTPLLERGVCERGRLVDVLDILFFESTLKLLCFGDFFRRFFFAYRRKEGLDSTK